MSELISGKEAKLAWANEEQLQVVHITQKVWEDLNDKHPLAVFTSDKYIFRLKPRTIAINGIEVPAPFKPKVGEEYFYIYGCRNNYARSRFNSEHCDQHLIALGAWRTEDEIKQVVAALRSVFNTKQSESL